MAALVVKPVTPFTLSLVHLDLDSLFSRIPQQYLARLPFSPRSFSPLPLLSSNRLSDTPSLAG